LTKAPRGPEYIPKLGLLASTSRRLDFADDSTGSLWP
jgi:hypothetical protein